MAGDACNKNAKADDLNGHGTAVIKLIKTIQPTADVHAVRVVDGNLSSSYELLCGLTYALWSDEFDVVNVSLAATMSSGVRDHARRRPRPGARILPAEGNPAAQTRGRRGQHRPSIRLPNAPSGRCPPARSTVPRSRPPLLPRTSSSWNQVPGPGTIFQSRHVLRSPHRTAPCRSR